jgi:hypothetical protein
MFANMKNTLAYCDWVSHKGEEKFYKIVFKNWHANCEIKMYSFT